VSRSAAIGTDFENIIVQGLREGLDDDRIERRARCGKNDRGDVSGVRLRGERIVIECKAEVNGKVFKLPEWVKEAREEAGNDDALVGVVAHKRTGSRKPEEQWISMTLADFIVILTGQRAD
jgi:hypothetical protein